MHARKIWNLCGVTFACVCQTTWQMRKLSLSGASQRSSFYHKNMTLFTPDNGDTKNEFNAQNVSPIRRENGHKGLEQIQQRAMPSFQLWAVKEKELQFIHKALVGIYKKVGRDTQGRCCFWSVLRLWQSWGGTQCVCGGGWPKRDGNELGDKLEGTGVRELFWCCQNFSHPKQKREGQETFSFSAILHQEYHCLLLNMRNDWTDGRKSPLLCLECYLTSNYNGCREEDCEAEHNLSRCLISGGKAFVEVEQQLNSKLYPLPIYKQAANTGLHNRLMMR